MTPQILISGITTTATFNIGADTLTYNLAVNNTIVPVTGGVETLVFIVRIVSPVGQDIYKNAGWDTGDFTSPDPQTGTYNLPTISGGGSPQAGEYQIEYQAKYTILPSTVTLSGIQTYTTETLCINCLPSPLIVPTLNCSTATLFIQDGTNWTLAGYSTSSTADSWTITPPAASSQPNQTGTGTEITVPYGLLYNGRYGISLASVVTFVKGNTTVVITVTTVYQDPDPSCNNTPGFVVKCGNILCTIQCVLSKIYKKYLTVNPQSASAGQIILNRYTAGLNIYVLIQGAINCGNDYSTFVTAFWNAVDESPECDCCSSSQTGLVQPIQPTGGGRGLPGPVGPTGATGLPGPTGPAGANGISGVGAFWAPILNPPYTWDGTTGSSGLNYIPNTIPANTFQNPGDSMRFKIFATLPDYNTGYILLGIAGVGIPALMQGISAYSAYCEMEIDLCYKGGNIATVGVTQTFYVPSYVNNGVGRFEDKIPFVELDIAFIPTVDKAFTIYFDNAGTGPSGVSVIENLFVKIQA